VLRAARFVASLEFELDPATASAIRPSLDSFKKVSPERVRDEWVKAMKSRKPSRAFSTMRDHGLLEITAPELQPAAGDNGPLELALRVVDLCPDSINVRFAALLHNLGSSCVAPILGLAPSVEAARAAELSYKLLQGLKFSNKDRDRIVALVRHQAILCPADLTDAELRRWLQQVTPVLVSDIEMLMTAIARAHVERTDLLEQVATLHARVRSILKQAPALKVSDLEVTGNDLVRECRVLPGPNVGRLLAALLELVIEQPDNNRRDFLVAAAKRWLSKNS
jgi:tRNA nucleotidyltransferase (CCA-adding enzyme)